MWFGTGGVSSFLNWPALFVSEFSVLGVSGANCFGIDVCRLVQGCESIPVSRLNVFLCGLNIHGVACVKMLCGFVCVRIGRRRLLPDQATLLASCCRGASYLRMV